MSLGAEIQSKGDLKRWLEQVLQEPGVLPPSTPQSPIALTKAGEPLDSDFPNTPGNGILALDTTGPRLWARTGGGWVKL
jgi:hypothetical protein